MVSGTDFDEKTFVKQSYFCVLKYLVMKKLSIFASVLMFTLVSCKTSSTTTSSNDNTTTEETVKPTDTSPKKPSLLISRPAATE